MKDGKIILICITGPTATGKTALAAGLAARIRGEIISADSRQVFKGMDIGTGKDLDDYRVGRKQIPFHLIDIHDPGDEYNVFEFQKDFKKAFTDIVSRDSVPVLCGGSGLYIESVLDKYELVRVPVNPGLRKELENKDLAELNRILSSYRDLHNTTDSLSRKRAIRAIEIEEYSRNHLLDPADFPDFQPVIIAIHVDREMRRSNITRRLKERLDNGKIEEVRLLHSSGISHERLEFFGLEYKFISLFLRGEMDYQSMFEGLNTAIHQFAKRQMTWFRRMERNGHNIHWLDGTKSREEKIADALSIVADHFPKLKGK